MSEGQVILNELKALREHVDRLAERPDVEGLRWLTFEDVKAITGFADRKLTDLIKKRTIPMFKAPGSNEWRMTRAAWAKCERDLERQGLLPKNVHKHRR